MQFSSILEDYFKGEFVINSTALRQKFRTIKAFVFDWDGVFNNGQKNIDGHSTFSEVDSMGVNLIRFRWTAIPASLWQRFLPVVRARGELLVGRQLFDN